MGAYRDRFDAGQQLAAALGEFAHCPETLVLGLPRGGVPVAFEVSRLLGLPLDVLVVRKVGVPGQEELAMGAVADGDVLVCNEAVIRTLGLSMALVRSLAEHKAQELAARQSLFRGGRPPLEVFGRTILLIDDGLATGSTMRAAVQSLRQRHPAQITVAVPVGSAEACEELAQLADRCICLQTPEPFHAVGYWYQDFGQVEDATVCALLRAQTVEAAPPASDDRSESSPMSTAQKGA